LAPAWYVLALSLMGLVLGVWLRQSEGRGGGPPGPPHRPIFFKKKL
ncbi:MFS transporter, partial [Enterobacter hormaechei]